MTAIPGLVVLRSEQLLAIVDPRHGAEILDLYDVERARHILGHPAYSPIDPVSGDLDEETWIRSYRGGWQLIAPNTGNACTVDDEWHGFQGSSSTQAWRPLEISLSAATFSWSGHGLAFERHVELIDDRVEVGVIVRAFDRPAPLALVEHVGFGISMLDPEVELDLPGGRTFEFSEEVGPQLPPADAGDWPVARMLDGSERRCDRWTTSSPDFVLISVADLPEGRAILRNAKRELGVELSWDTALLPHLWIWHEERLTEGLWRGATEMMALEPASTPHSLGLAEAIAHGQAHVIVPSQPREYRITFRVLRQEDVSR
jgi:hypothetical protein